MPVAYVGAAAGVASAAGSLIGSTSGGGGGGGGVPPGYQPKFQGTADQLYPMLWGQMGTAGFQLPQTVGNFLPGYLGNIGTTPGQALANQGANQAYSMTAQNTVPQAQGGANMMYNLAQQAMPYGAAGIGSAQQGLNYANQGMGLAGQVANTAFDPQSALYARTQQQVQDQANAINSMYGLSQSPYGAGVANQAMNNFNIDWQNQQLQRQLQGSQAYQGALAGYGGAQQGYANAEAGYGNMVNAIGKGVSGAYDLNTGAAGQIASASALPYQTAMGQQQDIASQLQQYMSLVGGSYGLDQSTANLLQSYLGMGQSANSQAQYAGVQNFGQQQALGAGAGAGLSQLGTAANQFANTGLGQTIQGSLGGLFSSSPGFGSYNPYSSGYSGYNDPYSANNIAAYAGGMG